MNLLSSLEPLDALCRGEAALNAAQSVLGMPELQGLQLYSFRAAAKRDRLYIRLDKVSLHLCSQTTMLLLLTISLIHTWQAG